jgi:hypothetical protein
VQRHSQDIGQTHAACNAYVTLEMHRPGGELAAQVGEQAAATAPQTDLKKDQKQQK